ncbi:GTP-binding protein [methane-oxidizing endosymbiont of Gigantopelta aegis]
MKTLHHIPTHLVLGFLGSGKTTAILHLLAQKPNLDLMRTKAMHFLG